MVRQKLTNRELAFCREYIYSGNAKDAAIKAGYKILPEAAGIKLLSDQQIKDEISAAEKSLFATKAEALKGYRRLAFGGISDAIRLIECEKDELPDLTQLDLFMVSEIKRPKGGGMEIKFYDRQKALERIEAISEGQDSDASVSFYRALEMSSLHSSGNKDDKNEDN